MNIKQERRNHKLKILILDLISRCEKQIKFETKFMERNKSYGLGVDNSRANIKRHETLKNYLIKRYIR